MLHTNSRRTNDGTGSFPCVGPDVIFLKSANRATCSADRPVNETLAVGDDSRVPYGAQLELTSAKWLKSTIWRTCQAPEVRLDEGQNAT